MERRHTCSIPPPTLALKLSRGLHSTSSLAISAERRKYGLAACLIRGGSPSVEISLPSCSASLSLPTPRDGADVTTFTGAARVKGSNLTIAKACAPSKSRAEIEPRSALRDPNCMRGKAGDPSIISICIATAPRALRRIQAIFCRTNCMNIAAIVSPQMTGSPPGPARQTRCVRRSFSRSLRRPDRVPTRHHRTARDSYREHVQPEFV